ncbi:MAG TPA: hypothetical protein VH327_02865, partial [Gammaproteobacteria bacterium]|nr:hypothetical protein [Gammaproteobacteria bacterium]
MSRRIIALRASAFFALIVLTGLAAADTPGIATPGGAVQVLRVTPSGDTRSFQRQVVIQFDRPMVVLGSVPPRLDSAPVTITPVLPCNWHWLNTSTLACELGERSGEAAAQAESRTHARMGMQVEQGGLAPATSYHVVVQAGIKALDGNTLESDVEDDFSTEQPAAQYGYPLEWSGPTDPVVEVMFNLPVTKSSVEAHLYFDSGAGRAPVSASAAPDDRRDYYVLPAAGGAPVHVASSQPGAERPADEEEEDENEGEDGGDEDGGAQPAPATASKAPAAAAAPAGEEARYRWLIAVRSSTQPLPGDTQVTLEQEAGLATPLGPDTGTRESTITRMQTYGEPEFLGITCGDHNDVIYRDDPANAGQGTRPSCEPTRYVYLVFSAPMKSDELKAHFSAQVNGKTVDPIGEVPDEERWARRGRGGEHFYVTFSTPLKAAADYTVQMSAGLKDVWGRPMQQSGSAGFHTEHREPDLTLEEETAVLEKSVDSEVPVYYTNLDQLSAHFTRLTVPKQHAAGDSSDSVEEKQVYDYILPGIADLAVGMALDVRKLLDGRSGVVQGVLDPTPSPQRRYYSEDYRFFAEVTPFHVEAK